MDFKQRIKKVKDSFKKLEKKGINLFDNIWGEKFKGRSAESIAKNPKSFDNFLKSVKRAEEHSKVVLESRKIDERLKQKKLQDKIEKRKKERRNILSEKTKSIVKFNYENVKPTKRNIRKLVKNEAQEFFNTYFKSIRSDKKLMKEVDNLSNRFGNRLDKLYDFIDKVTSIDFKYQYEGIEVSREEYEREFAENWNDLMEDRLNTFNNILNSKDYDL